MGFEAIAVTRSYAAHCILDWHDIHTNNWNHTNIESSSEPGQLACLEAVYNTGQRGGPNRSIGLEDSLVAVRH